MAERPSGSTEHTWSHHLLPIGLLLGAYVLEVLILHPFGDVLYGCDDFAYAWSTERLVRDHRLIASNWVSAAAVPQIFWGTLFSSVFGFSLRVLNVATLTLGALAAPLVYACGAQLGIQRRLATLVACFAIINPLFLGFASSFMSDAYFLILMLAAALCYLRGLNRSRLTDFALGGAAAAAALLQRQIGIVVPASIALTLALGVVAKRRSLERAALEASVAVAPPALTAVLYRLAPDWFGGVTHAQRVMLNSDAMWKRLLDVSKSFAHGYTTLVYVGVLLLPLAAAILPALLRLARGAVARFRWYTALFPVLGATLSVIGLVHEDLQIVAGEFLHSGLVPRVATGLWRALTTGGIFVLPALAGLMGLRIAERLDEPKAHARHCKRETALGAIFLCILLAALLTLTATFIAFYNNYFLPLVPLSLLLLGFTAGGESAAAPRWAPVAAAAACAGVWSILNLEGLYRYVEADARFTREITARGADRREVFGYPGTYAWLNYDVVDAAILENPRGMLGRVRERSRFVVRAHGLRPLPGRVIHTSTYETIAGSRQLDLLLQHSPSQR